MAATRITKQDLGTSVFATPTIALGTAASAGTTGQAPQSDATIVAFDITAPSTQAFGDAAAVGVAAVASRRDHKHAMPAAPAGGAPAVLLAAAGSAGAAATFLRTDDTIAAFDATAPSTQAFSDAAVVGVAAFAARRDHKHAMPASPGGLSASNFVDGEVPAGLINGANATFTLANTPSPSTSVALYKNGIRQNVGAGLDYTFVTATITFLAGNIPQTNDVILADYRK